jgi:hypothetical protein
MRRPVLLTAFVSLALAGCGASTFTVTSTSPVKPPVATTETTKASAPSVTGTPNTGNPGRGARWTSFHSPSHNISCELHLTEDKPGWSHPTQTTALCQTEHPPRQVSMPGAGTPLTQGTAIGNGPVNEGELLYGRSETLGPFTCLSLTTGMRCTVADGQGFEISRPGVTELHG